MASNTLRRDEPPKLPIPFRIASQHFSSLPTTVAGPLPYEIAPELAGFRRKAFFSTRRQWEISGNRSRIVHGERFCENRKFLMEFLVTGSTYLLRQ